MYSAGYSLSVNKAQSEAPACCFSAAGKVNKVNLDVRIDVGLNDWEHHCTIVCLRWLGADSHHELRQHLLGHNL